MWNTPKGLRVLSGNEAKPVREAIAMMVDQIHEEASGFLDAGETGVELFDQLSWTQRLTLLDQVVSALLTPSFEISKHNALHDATVGAVFNFLEELVAAEIFESDSVSWRMLVREAYRSCFESASDDSEFLPTTLGDRRKDRWAFVILLMADRVLHDRDYEAAGTFLDRDPDEAAAIRQIMGIDDTYYAEAGDDVSEHDAEMLFQRIRQLTASGS